jgi:hypothetical protein
MNVKLDAIFNQNRQEWFLGKCTEIAPQKLEWKTTQTLPAKISSDTCILVWLDDGVCYHLAVQIQENGNKYLLIPIGLAENEFEAKNWTNAKQEIERIYASQ